jgi:tripartite-type tricarboxylate transporter receptor subunit TctC
MVTRLWMLVVGIVFLAAPVSAASVEDFYKGKTIRIVVGYGPGGATDTNARLLQKVLPKHIPGNPNIVVENKPGGGSMLAANTVYAAEPADGTVIAAFASDLALQQAMGASGVRFDAAKYQWIGSAFDTSAMCAVRLDSGVTRLEDAIGERGKEVVLSSFGKGGLSHIPAVVFNAVFGTKFKVVTGYPSGAAQRLAVKNNEAQGFCTTFQTVKSTDAGMFEGPGACCKVLIVAGSEAEEHSFLKGVPVAEKLAEKLGKSRDDIAMLRAMNAPNRISLPQAMAPGVPKDRVDAIRRAYTKSYTDPELQAAAAKMDMDIQPKTGEEVTRIVHQLLQTPKAVLARMAELVR